MRADTYRNPYYVRETGQFQVRKSTFLASLIAIALLSKVFALDTLLDLLLLAGAIAIAVHYMFMSHSKLQARFLTPLSCFAIYLLLYLVLTAINPSFVGIKNTIGIFIAMMFLMFGMFNARQFALSATGGTIFLSTAIILAIFLAPFSYVAKNTISGVSLYLALAGGAIFVFRNPKSDYPALLTFGLMIVLSVHMGHRMAVGSSLAALLIYSLVRFLPFSFIKTLLLFSMGGTIVLLVVAYAGVGGFDIRDYNEFFTSVSGRNAVSGREVIWPIILQAVSQNRFVGLGTGINFSDLYQTSWSAHSIFMQVYMQSGILGLILWILTLFSIWQAIGKPNKGNRLSAFATANFLVVLFHSSTEVFLTQVNLAIGVMAWISLGLCIGLLQLQRNQLINANNIETLNFGVDPGVSRK